jgi:SAM-dependent methyltransferase
LRVLMRLEDYLRYDDETAGLKFCKRAVTAQLRLAGRKPPALPGYSVTAEEKVGFTIDRNLKLPDGNYNLRETVNCPKTGFNTRMRAAVHAVKHFETRRSVGIYMAEQKTPLFAYFKTYYSDVTGSEYLGEGVPLGSHNTEGLRNEDATQLTFADESFEVFLSFEVLEHIPDYKKALFETHRVLRPGGRFYFTAPFAPGRQNTVVRARIENGKIVHMLEPEYHGDPIRSEGILCFQHFGWDIVDSLAEAGFTQIEALAFDQPDHGYYTQDPIIVFRAVA